MKLVRKTQWVDPQSGAGHEGIEKAVKQALVSLPREFSVFDLPRMAEFILKNKKDIHELLGQLIENTHPPGTLDGLSFCVDTVFVDRSKIQGMIRSAGGMVHEYWTQKTTYFVVGERTPRYATQEAKDLGVKIISEDTLARMIRKIRKIRKKGRKNAVGDRG